MLAGHCSSYLASSQPHFPFRHLSYQRNASIHITGEGSVLAIEPDKRQSSIKGVYIICFNGNSHYWACLHAYEMEVGILICQSIKHYSNGVQQYLQRASLNLPYYTIHGQLQSVTIRFYMYLFYYVLASLNMLRL